MRVAVRMLAVTAIFALSITAAVASEPVKAGATGGPAVALDKTPDKTPARELFGAAKAAAPLKARAH